MPVFAWEIAHWLIKKRAAKLQQSPQQFLKKMPFRSTILHSIFLLLALVLGCSAHSASILSSADTFTKLATTRYRVRANEVFEGKIG